MAGAEEECSLADGLLELSGGGLSGIVLRHKWCQEIGQKLEVQLSQFQQEVRVIVRQLFNQEVVKVNHLEDLCYQ